MTPPRLFKSVGIKTIKDLTERTGLSRHMCHMLWHGQVRAGREAGEAIARCTGINIAIIFEVCNGKKAKRSKIKPGMVCELTYEGSGSESKLVSCRP